MDNCFVLIGTRQHCVAKICNANPTANAHKLQKDPFTIPSSVLLNSLVSFAAWNHNPPPLPSRPPPPAFLAPCPILFALYYINYSSRVCFHNWSNFRIPGDSLFFNHNKRKGMKVNSGISSDTSVFSAVNNGTSKAVDKFFLKPRASDIYNSVYIKDVIFNGIS